MPIVKRLAKKAAKPITEADRRLIDAATVIRQEPGSSEAAFLARHLVQCTLPHSDPGDVPAWTRTSGNVGLVIQPGWDHDKGCPIGYPFGVIPRLLLFWLITELVRVKDRDDLTLEQKCTVHLGRRLDDFMVRIGLNPDTGNGKRGDRKRLQEQAHRLFRSRISFQQTFKGPKGETRGERWLNMDVAPKGELWWDHKRPAQGTLFESWVKVGTDFFEAVTSVPVPVDLRALKALKRSPLALDLYALTAWVTFLANKQGAPVSLKWRNLADQLGGDYGDVDNLKKRAQRALLKVKAVSPGLVVSMDDGGFSVHPGRTPIGARSS